VDVGGRPGSIGIWDVAALECEVVAERLAAEYPDDDSLGRLEPEAEVPKHLLRCPADTGGRFHLCLAQVVDGRTESEPGGIELLREIVHARSLAVATHAVTYRRLGAPLYNARMWP
jgi:hypothetical protein